MLVSNTRLGSSLAQSFSSQDTEVADKTVVLMSFINYHLLESFADCCDSYRRGHGLTVVAERIEDVVMRCIYTLNNAKLQTTALLTRSAYLTAAPEADKKQIGSLAFLGPQEARDAGSMNQNTVMRPWKLWCREVEADPLYINHG